MVKADYAHYYVAEEAGEITGYCGLRNMAGEGEITNVAVAPLFRRKGTGRRLMEYLLKKAPSCGIGDCTLEVRAGNSPAISLYESLGFRTEGIRPGFYAKPREDALIMWKRQEEQGCVTSERSGTGDGYSGGTGREKAGLYFTAESLHRRYPAVGHGNSRQQGI